MSEDVRYNQCDTCLDIIAGPKKNYNNNKVMLCCRCLLAHNYEILIAWIVAQDKAFKERGEYIKKWIDPEAVKRREAKIRYYERFFVDRERKKREALVLPEHRTIQ